MPDTKTASAPEAESEDTELADIEQAVRTFDETALRGALQNDGVSSTLIELLVGQAKAQNETNKRLLQRQQRQDTTTYQAVLRDQFPYAFDADGKPLFSGSTKSEMRRAAEKLHNHTASIVGSVGKAAPKAAPGELTDAQRERAEAYGNPPEAAAEVVRETPDRTWDAMRSDAIHKPATQVEETKRAVIQDLKNNGPRQMRRASLADIASRQSQKAAREAAAAKA